jgi:hypothetical protein
MDGAGYLIVVATTGQQEEGQALSGVGKNPASLNLKAGSGGYAGARRALRPWPRRWAPGLLAHCAGRG